MLPSYFSSNYIMPFIVTVPQRNVTIFVSDHHTTRESHIYLRPVFYLYRIFLALVQITTFVPFGGTNRYKCPLIGSHRGLLLVTP
jgi:hypothetical protein